MAPVSIFEQILDPANRADPWPLYAELRTVPVRREANGTYVVSRYRDIVALLHDPRISSARSLVTTPDQPRSIIVSDPPEHDRVRRILFEFVVRTVDELLRYEPPVHFINREAVADIDLAGTTIPAGSPIVLAYAAGSRNPDHVPDPDRFDPDRTDPEGPRADRMRNEHLGFGGGVHYCFGAPLARAETQIALTELVARLDNPRLLADPPPYRANPLLRGPRHLPVAYGRVLPAGATGVPHPRRGAEQPAGRQAGR